jgi:DNA replicative helicase MCM subunit Mcm2 (Cdc46/Mcm family)
MTQVLLLTTMRFRCPICGHELEVELSQTTAEMQRQFPKSCRYDGISMDLSLTGPTTDKAQC